ncbi:MAG: hypothetical protein JWM90_815, partial [Thermoleophilia bacterium]|nr:hypothetical protein [Thermoleophilia bacterium]
MAPWRPATGWALFASSIIFVSAAISHGLESGARGGVAALLAWMITRELAPKRMLPSLLAPFAAVAWAIPAETDLLACVTVLLAARIASRTVGAPPTGFDCVVLIALAGWAATRPAGLPVALVLAAILFTSARGLTRTRVAGLVALIVVLFVGSVEGTLTLRPEWEHANLAVQVLYAFAMAAALLLLLRPLPTVLAVRDDR